MLAISLSILLWFGVLLGLGLLLERFLLGSLPINSKRLGPGTISSLGLSGLAFWSLLINFFIPLSQFVTWTTLGLGWGGLLIQIKGLRTLFSNTEIAIGITSVFAVSLIAVLSYFNIDTGYLLIAFVLSIRGAILTHPLSIDLIHWPRISNFESVVYKGEGNIDIRNPVGDFRCWNMTAPCTPDRTVFTIHNSEMSRPWFSPGDKK